MYFILNFILLLHDVQNAHHEVIITWKIQFNLKYLTDFYQSFPKTIIRPKA